MHAKTLRIALIVDGKPAGEPIDLELNSFGVISFRDHYGSTVTIPGHELGLRNLLETIQAGGSKEAPKTIIEDGQNRTVSNQVQGGPNAQWVGR